ncbi:disease resistance protein RPV1-like isoform X2 [Trifolium pratense]|uniref:disease resistance protein RPV1-like isoform X2 n=1 Tax=Trifolium pratense TaxID=57577 RepID=UPI001E69396C|nr:disease resistance protein RPV1-like isoform X2 [Trifolium pratense]
MHKIEWILIWLSFICLFWFMPKSVVENHPNNNVPEIHHHHKYDVFVNFRGSDIRKGFLAHLIKALSEKKIVTFVDDKLKRGDEISALYDAIEKSLISLVIFSQNYTSSAWCLDELVKIVECREKNGQILLPVFYKVDPTNVRNQNGSYGNIAVAEQEKWFDSSRVAKWKSALKKSADISGFPSSDFSNDAKLIEEIVKVVLKRLDHGRLVNSKGIVGIGKQISNVESLLQLESQDVRAIGIWGMSGIGKTTIAEEVYSKLCSEYDGCYSMTDVREECRKNGIMSLKKEIYSTLLKQQDLDIDTRSGLPSSVVRMLRRMKVLVVLDGVNDLQQLNYLIGSTTLDWFGNGSRIIITSGDKQVLVERGVDIYEVKALDFDDSLMLFNMYAFEQNHAYQEEYYELSKMMVKHAAGIPPALEHLGRRLRGKDIEAWEKQLGRLKKRVPIKKVHEIFKLSYNDLDRHEQKILLDIACFFDGLNLKNDDIQLLVKDRDYSLADELDSLINKALITISPDNVVSMLNIIQQTALEIVREESNDDPGKQSRLQDPDDIYYVLKNNKGSEAIRSLAIDVSIIKELQLHPKVFAKMNKLRYLDIYSNGYSYDFVRSRGGLNLSQGLEYLPNELRYLRWARFPLESLPCTFSGEKLVVLDLQYSRVRKLWHDDHKDLANLKYLKLGSSSDLLELPDLSNAKNLEVVDLRLCTGLTSVHPSVFTLNKLEKLDLGGCFSLRSFRSNIRFSSLRYLSLAGCTALKEFSVTSKEMVNLNLELSGIKQLPSAIGLQTKLEKLLLAHSYIENLPKSIKHLPRLRHLDLRHCRKLRSLPKLPSSLITLNASDCVSLENVTFPSTDVQMLKENKTRVSFWNCLKLDQHSLRAIGLNAQINIKKFAHQHISISLDHDHDAQGTYVYPGSSVPEWLVYRTTHDYMTIDLSFVNHSSPLAFILCFIVPQVESPGFILRFNIGIDEGEDIQLYLDRPSREIKSDHVYLISDRGFSRYLNNQVKDQPKFKIKVTAESHTLTSDYVSLIMLRGFGVSPINTS